MILDDFVNMKQETAEMVFATKFASGQDCIRVLCSYESLFSIVWRILYSLSKRHCEGFGVAFLFLPFDVYAVLDLSIETICSQLNTFTLSLQEKRNK